MQNLSKTFPPPPKKKKSLNTSFKKSFIDLAFEARWMKVRSLNSNPFCCRLSRSRNYRFSASTALSSILPDKYIFFNFIKPLELKNILLTILVLINLTSSVYRMISLAVKCVRDGKLKIENFS